MEASFTFGYSKLRDINGRKKDPARGQGQFNLGTNAQKNVIFFIQQVLILDMLPTRQLHHATRGTNLGGKDRCEWQIWMSLLPIY